MTKGVLSYLGGAFIVDIIIGLNNPQLLQQPGIILSLLGFIGGAIGVGITFFIFKSYAERKNFLEHSILESDIIDDIHQYN